MLAGLEVVLPPWAVSVEFGAKEPEIRAVPVADGVKVKLQVAVGNVPGSISQLPDELKLPVAVPAETKFTFPAGKTAVPALEESATVAVQDEGVFTVTGLVQFTLVEVERRLIVILKAVAVLLALWAVSSTPGA